MSMGVVFAAKEHETAVLCSADLDQPKADVGASRYWSISVLARNSVMLKPGPLRLVMYVPLYVLDGLIPLRPVYLENKTQ